MDSRIMARDTERWYSSLDLGRKSARIAIDDLDELLEQADDEHALRAGLQAHMNEDGEVLIPVKFEVCHLCGGTGRHVDPNVDSHGICADEWDDMGPDGQEAYMSGAYDVTCYECSGRNVIPIPKEDSRLTKAQQELLKLINDKQRADADYAAQCAAERRM